MLVKIGDAETKKEGMEGEEWQPLERL